MEHQKLKNISAPQLVAEARTWLGTPYCHQASLRGVGCDCLGLIRGLWRWLDGNEPDAVPGYSSSWSVAVAGEELLCAARRNFVELKPDEARESDVVLFRMRKTSPANHVGFISSKTHFIHAYDGNCVVETQFSNFWQLRIAGVFRFPQIQQGNSF